MPRRSSSVSSTAAPATNGDLHSHFLPLNDDILTTRGHRLPLILSGLSQSFRDANGGHWSGAEDEETGRPAHSHGEGFPERRLSSGAEALMTPQMRSMRLIGNSNPRYRWERYYKTPDQLKKMRKPIRQYYERNNFLIAQYLYIDRLLDSSLPRDLIEEYNTASSKTKDLGIPAAISEDPSQTSSPPQSSSDLPSMTSQQNLNKVKRTPRNLYKVADSERTPLLPSEAEGSEIEIPDIDQDGDISSGDRIVTVAIYINLVANIVLLAGKVAVMLMTSSVSILASLVDATLDFLSTAIVWTTTQLIARQDSYRYPVGRRRLEPIGVLVFSVIMIASFCQVGLECISRLSSGDHTIVSLSLPAIIIMTSTVVVKFLCWLWCRLIQNSSVQALAQDAMTDIVFNIFSIIFPLVGYYAKIWWLDALGGLILSIYVIVGWSMISSEHIRNLTGAAASADQRNVLLYLTMRFAKTIKQIQGLQAYHTGDKLIVEVDIVLDEHMSLRDSHDLGESLQYVLESVPMVDRAFVHSDYLTWNIPTHMNQQE